MNNFLGIVAVLGLCVGGGCKKDEAASGSQTAGEPAVGAKTAEAAEPNKGDDKGPNSNPEGKGVDAEAANLAADLDMAHQLANWGHENKNPHAMVVAAEILKTRPTTESKATKEEAAEGEAPAAKEGEFKVSAESVIALAKEYAAGDEGLLASVAKVEGLGASKGPEAGPGRHCDTVRAGATDTYRVMMEGNAPWQIGVEGDGDTDLDLRVYDENGGLLASDLDGTDTMYASGHTRWAGPFTIRIENLGGVYNNYCMILL